MIGKKFGRWTVIGDVFVDEKKHKRCLCRCECGKERAVGYYNLIRGESTSCGCYNRDVSREICRKRNYRENRYEINGEVTKVYDALDRYFLIDTEDLPKIKSHYFLASKRYAMTCGRKNVLVHRLVMNCPDNMVVDHINGNKLDNRKCNLRICTHRENCQNNTKRVSACYVKEKNKWRALIHIDGKATYIGYFNTKEEAISAKISALNKVNGDFSPTKRDEVINKNVKRNTTNDAA